MPNTLNLTTTQLEHFSWVNTYNLEVQQVEYRYSKFWTSNFVVLRISLENESLKILLLFLVVGHSSRGLSFVWKNLLSFFFRLCLNLLFRENFLSLERSVKSPTMLPKTWIFIKLCKSETNKACGQHKIIGSQ